MTTEDGPAGRSARSTTVTTLPSGGRVLVRSAGVPAVPTERCVDVRPGPFATFDGDRLRSPVSVSGEDGRRRFARDELPAMEDAVVAFLRDGGPTPGDERDPTDAGGHAGAVVRFGDRAACRRSLPDAAVETLERRLGVAAGRGGAALLTWTTAPPRPVDYGTYDVVLDPAPTRSD